MNHQGGPPAPDGVGEADGQLTRRSLRAAGDARLCSCCSLVKGHSSMLRPWPSRTAATVIVLPGGGGRVKNVSLVVVEVERAPISLLCAKDPLKSSPAGGRLRAGSTTSVYDAERREQLRSGSGGLRDPFEE